MVDDPLAAGEKLLWTGRPSHAVAAREYGQRLGFLGLALIVAVGLRHITHGSALDATANIAAVVLLLVAALSIVTMYLEVNAIEYDITTLRLRRWGGVLSRRMEEIELFRVRETALEEPWFERAAGVSSIVVAYTDSDGHTSMLIAAIPDADQVRNTLRSAVEACRKQNNVRALEIEE